CARSVGPPPLQQPGPELPQLRWRRRRILQLVFGTLQVVPTHFGILAGPPDGNPAGHGSALGLGDTGPHGDVPSTTSVPERPYCQPTSTFFPPPEVRIRWSIREFGRCGAAAWAGAAPSRCGGRRGPEPRT